MSQSAIVAAIGVKLIKGLLAIWLKDKEITKLASELTIDIFDRRANDWREARKARRFFEELADRASENLSKYMESEHGKLPKGDAKQIMEASVDLIGNQAFYDLCFEERLSVDRIMKSSRSMLEDQAKSRSVNLGVLESVFRFLLTEFVLTLDSLPEFDRVAFRTILEDTELIIEKINLVQARVEGLASDDQSTKQEHTYRKHFARKFRLIQLFGVTSHRLTKRYDLTIGYISLTISNDDSEGAPIEQALSSDLVAEAGFNLIIGAPGSGKTTILSWLALNSADRSLPKELEPLNLLTPVFVSARDYTSQDLPKGKDILISQVGAYYDALDPKWVRQQLASGRFLFLLDGFDEVNDDRQQDIVEWIIELKASFPKSKFFITSRPYAAGRLYTELRSSLDDSVEYVNWLQVEPMDLEQIGNFVDHWYRAYSHDANSADQLDRLRAARERLQAALSSSATLRAISSNPLLCALICFVNADREGFVPTARGELYDTASETLLERREQERNILRGSDLKLNRTQKFKILGFVSEYFFNRRANLLPLPDVIEHIKTFLPALGLDAAESGAILKFLIERSQILRSPEEGKIDFSHKTFQEYFYARRIVDANLREIVADEFFHSDKAEVILFVSALAPTELFEFVVRKAIKQLSKTSGIDFRKHVIFLHSCITEAGEMNVEVRGIIAEKLSSVLPPRTTKEAEELGSAGTSIIDPLSRFMTPSYKESWVHCATALVATMDEDVFPALTTLAKLGDKGVDQILLAAKRYFESARYNRTVLAHCSHIDHLNVHDHFDLELLSALSGLVAVKIVDYRDEFILPQVHNSVINLRIEKLHTVRSMEMLRRFPHLRKLEIINSPNIEDFSEISYCKELRELVIESEDAIVELGFLEGLNELRTLDVSGCLALEDVQAIDNLLKISKVALPYSQLYEQLNPRFRQQA